MASSTLATPPNLYVPKVPETSNIRFAENRIILIPQCQAHRRLRLRNEDEPAEMGDVLYEEIKKKTRSPKVYTVVARISGLLWVVSGVDEGETVVKRTVTFVTAPLDHGSPLFSRVFQEVRQYRPDLDSASLSVMRPAAIQAGLERLKALVEERWVT